MKEMEKIDKTKGKKQRNGKVRDRNMERVKDLLRNLLTLARLVRKPPPKQHSNQGLLDSQTGATTSRNLLTSKLKLFRFRVKMQVKKKVEGGHQW